MIELAVVMTIMTIVMSVFTTMVLTMYRSANKVDAKATAQSQIATAMARLDRELRYAKGISLPYTIGGSPYLDFLATQQGAATCIQLRVSAGILAQRTWAYPQGTPPAFAAWTTLASGITSATPFVYVAPTASTGFQQLKVTLNDGTATGSDQNVATFTALNSSRSASNDYCNAARS